MSASKRGLIQPDVRFLFSKPAHFIALGFGSGLPRKAPGTFGTLAALPLYALMLWLGLGVNAILAVCAVTFLIGWWAAHVTGHDLGVHDHGGIVIDEIVAMWLVLFLVPTPGAGSMPLAEIALWWGIAFAAFRLFDIWKPWPIRFFDARVPGGFGVMLDDILAAVYAGLLVWLLQAAARLV